MKLYREEVTKMHYVCIQCGMFIRKSALSDPYVCRGCEKILEGADRERAYGYLDAMY